MIEYKNIKEALEQLEKCKFIDEVGHPLEKNTAFQYLKELANDETLLFSLIDKETLTDCITDSGFGLYYANEREQARINKHRGRDGGLKR